MSKEEVALELALKMLDNFSYDVQNYGGTTKEEHVSFAAKLAFTIYNDIYGNLDLD
ncbi:Uncharacterised protein [Acetobacterium wieringae]|uniref:hypothetical protein n=1 Tax=Acetobacterium wieringae TaxID=52694 RepID=UPI001D26ED5F|nr:hypothetical protein [Acetobacterium wieringae]VUZ28489.1 Uncharacterised protein [Acetobacterium wieringae]